MSMGWGSIPGKGQQTGWAPEKATEASTSSRLWAGGGTYAEPLYIRRNGLDGEGRGEWPTVRRAFIHSTKIF